MHDSIGKPIKYNRFVMPTDIVYAHLVASDCIAIVMKKSIGRRFTEMYNENDIKQNKELRVFNFTRDKMTTASNPPTV